MSLKKNKNYVDLEKTYCKSISKSMYDILRYSLNEDFRNKLFDLFRVSGSKEIEKELNKRLVSIIQNCQFNQVNVEKSFISAPDVLKNLSRPELLDETKPFPHTGTYKKFLPSVHFAKRNQLQLPCETEKENSKKMKLCYYSQPTVMEVQTDNTDLEFSSCNICYNNSPQASSSCSSCSQSQENLSLSSCDINYCKTKFKKLFKDDVQKYFKKNLKLKKI